MSYKGLAGAHSPDVPHLGGNIKVGDPFTYSPCVWDYVISRFCVGSVLDLGSGSGNASHYFHAKGLKVLAVEGFKDSVTKSLYPAMMHDITKSAVYTQVDLVHCQEVVEHIDEEYLDNLLDSLISGKYILMTHALPGQHGYHHVNLQPPGYWIDHLNRRECTLLDEDTARIRLLGQRDNAVYLAKSGMVFVNNARL